MFKRMFTMIMVMAMIIGTFAFNASAVCLSEDGRPDFIGSEYFDDVIELSEIYEEEDREIEYTIEINVIEKYWVVLIEGYADEVYGYSAMGVYDHMPTEEEIDILWANRMTEDEFGELVEKYGI